MDSHHTARSSNRRLAALAAVTALFAATTAFACNVPVFRYALEHWNPDAYRAVIYHRGPLPEAVEKRLATFRPGQPNLPANLSFRTVDLQAEPDAADREFAATLKDDSLPQLVVRYPARHQIDAVVWQGSIDDAAFDTLLKSPARDEILKRLVSGQTAVWLLIASGDAAQDDAAELALEQELKNLTSSLKLPERTDAPEDAIGDGPDLRVEFSTLRVMKNHPAEASLVSMLINSEPDLTALNEPLVFPIFGRGRALLPLVGPGISPENIRGSARFLTGACSCQVKEQNPGFDLLVAANWSELIPWAKSPVNAVDALATPAKPELIPIAAGAVPPATVATTAEKPAPPPEAAPPAAPASTPAPTPEVATAPPETPAATTALPPPPAGRMPMGVIAIGVILLVAGFLVIRR